MNYFPIFMKLDGQPVLVIGGGKVAERKTRLLLAAGAKVYIVARQLNAACQDWLDAGWLTFLSQDYQSGHLDHMRLVFAASDDAGLNHRVFHDAEAKGIPANVVDDPAYCRFISPAVIDRSPVQIAISTGGAAPALARRLRSMLEAQLPQDLGRLARAAGRVRKRIRNLIPASRLRMFWDKQFSRDRLFALANTPEQQIERKLLDAARGNNALSAGKVYLVGAGPGRPDLLTLRALQVLGQADVILHDRLVPESILELARRDADRIDVGKRAGYHHKTQEEIHEIMLVHARNGLNVVRLKGGDPFIFGRGGEELEVLRKHNIEYEVVPGITAAAGCSAFAGIPLTHRDHAGIVSFVTGHAANGEQPDWASLAGPGRTVVVYMGVKQARRIRKQMLSAGINANTPAALIANGTTDTQETVIATLGDLPTMAMQCNVQAPALFIIGQVAELGSRLAWFSIPVVSAKAA